MSHIIARSLLTTHVDWIQESPTLNLVRDYSRFVITFFEVISTSAPHIYHSALPLSPQSSVVRELYKQCACPLTRVVQGLPISWGLTTATLQVVDQYGDPVWSPCGRFIAVPKSGATDILDAVTLKRLNTLEHTTGLRLCFSLDSRFLTQFGKSELVSWDLQTGSPVGTISSGLDVELGDVISSTYSMDGMTVAATCFPLSDDNGTFIVTYNLLSMTHMSSYRVSEGRIITPIWTHDECLRFATMKPGTTTIWEVAFTFIHPPVQVESLPAPGEIPDGEVIDGIGNFLFLPALSRLAFTLRSAVFVWDARASRFLLDSGPIPASNFTGSANQPHTCYEKSFSSDGRFFACTTGSGDVKVWQECPAGYIIHQQLTLTSINIPIGLYFSPNGESIIIHTNPTIYLWNTRDQTHSSSIPAQDGNPDNFVLAFSENEALVAFARWREDTVTILDLQSGDPRLVVDVDMEVECLGLTESAIVAVDQEKIVTWNIPGGNHAPDDAADINDNVQLDRSAQISVFPSISRDLSRIFILEICMESEIMSLAIYDASTGRCLARTQITEQFGPVWFTPDGSEVRVGEWSSSVVNGWKVVEGGESGSTELETLGPIACPPEALPWQSTLGYEITHDGWILGPAQERLLWLPDYWRSDEKTRKWGGRFLGLGCGELPEVVVLEFLQ